MHDTSDSAPHSQNHLAIRAGGWSFILAAVGFMAVFSYLAAAFNYPTVLDGEASEVLPKLLALGITGRAVWIVYALIPFLMIPAAIGTQAAFGGAAPNATRAATIFSTITAVSMFLGLARWPSVHWELARAYATSGNEAQQAMDAIFRGLNVYLGNFVGEFLGELGLNAFFFLSAYAAWRSGFRKTGYAGFLVALIGLIAAARNAASSVALVAELNNFVLPVWLIAFGLVLLRTRRIAS